MRNRPLTTPGSSLPREELWMGAARDAGWIPPGRRMFAVSLPFQDGGRMVMGSLTIPRPLTDEEWAYMMDVLNAMRPGLVFDAA